LCLRPQRSVDGGDAALGAFPGQGRNEELIDLQQVHREAQQMGERRVSGAEVVDGQLHAELVHRGETPDGLVGIHGQRTLGELDDQPTRVDPDVGQRPSHSCRRVTSGQFLGREVHRHPRRGAVRTLLVPGPDEVAGPQQHERTDPGDHPARLGHVDELAGRDLEAGPTPPSRQRLEPHDLAVTQRHHGLEGWLYLAALDGAVQRDLQVLAPLEAVAHAGVETSYRSLAVPLGFVHGEVGVTKEAIGTRRIAGRADGDAHAGAQEPLQRADHEGRAQGGDDLSRRGFGRGNAGAAGAENDEPVAGQAVHLVFGPHAGPDPLGRLTEDHVADRVAGGVVDHLEAIEVDEQQGGGATGVHRRQTVQEGGPVGEAGEGVEVHLRGQQGLGRFGRPPGADLRPYGHGHAHGDQGHHEGGGDLEDRGVHPAGERHGGGGGDPGGGEREPEDEDAGQPRQ